MQAYLDKRRIRRGIAVRFGMGAAPDSWDALLTAMTHKGYTKQELISAGLAVNGEERTAVRQVPQSADAASH